MARRRISSFRPGALILAFLVASFLFYLVVPTLELERRRLTRK